MRSSNRYPEWLIVVGCCISFRAGSLRVWEADIRWLHFFQAWMYLATMWLALRRNRWDTSSALARRDLGFRNVFVTTFFLNGLQQLVHWMTPGTCGAPI